MSDIELRYGKFGPYFHDTSKNDGDLSLNEVCTLLNDEQRLRREARCVLKQLDELAQQWGDEAMFRRCRDRLREALEHQAELVRCPYGRCPHCDGDVKQRERRPNGNDTCENGHVYPSRLSR